MIANFFYRLVRRNPNFIWIFLMIKNISDKRYYNKNDKLE